ncbi:MAG: hypothetical protein IT509_13125 [Rhodocyclaceae bacterium]|nr:hypothetical protein [Rhodocyclaceae bacterium]
MQSTRLVHLALLAVLAAAIGGCSEEQVKGSPNMPADFGQVPRIWLGCPDLSGLYAWPPVQGSTIQYSIHGRPSHQNGGTLEPLKAPVYPQAQVWISGPRDREPIELRTRPVIPDTGAAAAPARAWHQGKLVRYACEGNWLVFEGDEQTHPVATAYFGGTMVRHGMRLARLKDGSLAIGQWLRVSGGRGGVRWGDTTLVEGPLPDRVTWNWSRLQKIGDTGKDAPADAAASR